MTEQLNDLLETEFRTMMLLGCPPIPDHHPRIATNRYPAPRNGSKYNVYLSTACYRMYQGTWRIRNGGFYLVAGDGCLEVLGGKPVLAEWYSGKFTAGGGRVFGMRHLFGSGRWEQELDVEIKKGRVVTVTERRIVDGQTITRRLRRRETPGRRERIIYTLARACRPVIASVGRLFRRRW